MRLDREHIQAEELLRFLLERPDPDATLCRVGWTGLAPLARRHGVLLRVADRLTGAGVTPPPSFEDVVRQERRRADAALRVVHGVSAACEEHGVVFLFPKAFQHLPDIGTDLDMLIAADAPDVDVHFLQRAGIRARRRASHRLTAATVFEIDGCPTLLDVQRGRLGRMGEAATFASLMLGSAQRRVLNGVEIRVLPAEYQLILQGMQRVFWRTSIRLSDLFQTISLLRRESINWEQLLQTARQLRLVEELACYLTYVDQINREVLGRPRLTMPAALTAPGHRWGRLEFRGGTYRFPTVWVNTALYVSKLGHAVRKRSWDVAARLSLAPAVAVASVVRGSLRTGLRAVTPGRRSRARAARHLSFSRGHS